MTDLQTPFHEGELAIQERLGVRELVHSYAPKFVRSFLPQQHRDLLETLPFIVVGSVDSNQQPSASILFGSPGFIQSPDETTMQVEATPTNGDPLRKNLREGSPLGFLAIDFETRRRNRLTGKVTQTHQNGFAIKVDQSFGNCPQYIQSRTASPATEGADNSTGTITTPLGNAELAKRLAAADTFFIASSHFEDQDDRKHGVDVSHRGGKPGFMDLADNTLKFPDFSGNNHYNTFGNIALNPKVGIVVPDFDTGDMLYIEGIAEIIWGGPEVEAFDGAERLVSVQITKTTLVERTMPVTWKLNDYSPSLEATGEWDRDDAAADDNSEQWRSLRVDRIERESSTINSFYLTATDGLPLESYIAGQHLPVRHPSVPKAIRTYTLSKAPCGSQYRLSIKREALGKFSRFMHDDLRVGTTIDAMSPRGMFHMPKTMDKPQVLISAGVGITPMIAMLEAAVNTSGCTDGKKASRQILFIHAARNGDEHAFKNHPILSNPADFGVTVLLAYSQPTPQDIIDNKFHIRGRIDAQSIADLLPGQDVDAFLCGPDTFMTDVRAHLNAAGVNDSQIDQEIFGGPAVAQEPMPDVEISVQLKSSGKQLVWNPSQATLLETIEEAGVDAPFSCRTGNCGTCVTKVLKGRLSNPQTAQYKPAEDEALICCAVPGKLPHNSDIRLDL